MRKYFLLFLSFMLVPGDTSVFACAGNEYWSERDWTKRNEIELEKPDSQITDNLLRAALAGSGVTPCPSVEKDLRSASMKIQRAIRSVASPDTRQRGWENYDEITHVMIRHRLRPNEYGVLEVLTRTKICKDGSGRFVPAPPQYQGNAAALADKIYENLTTLLSR
jgi:hypothetical protein